MKNMKAIKILFLLLFFAGGINAQNCCDDGNCYIRLDDISGVDTDEYQDSLQAAACRLVLAFPEEFRRDFKVYDFGFYLHNEDFEGEYPAVFEQVKSKIESPYYLLFGKQTDSTGVYTKIWVAVKLPETGKFGCTDENMLDGLYYELTGILNKGKVSFMVYADREKEAMKSLGDFVRRTTHCCDVEEGREGKISERFIVDSLNYKLVLWEGNNINKPLKKNDMVLINSTPEMPDINYKINVYDSKNQLINDSTCFSSYTVKVSVKFIKKGKPKYISKWRNDTMWYKSLVGGLGSQLKPGFTFSWKNLYNFDFAGGKAVFYLYDSFLGLLDSFNLKIGGINPTANDVYTYIEDENYDDDYWFFKKMITLEQGDPMPSVLSDSLKQFHPYGDSESRMPNISYDFGCGLGQYTDPSPSIQALWNWKTNIDDSYEKMKNEYAGYGMRRIVRKKLLEDLKIVNKWNNKQTVDSLKVKLIDTTYAGIRWRYSPSPTFSGSRYSVITNYFTQTDNNTNEHSFIDACLMLAYNGYGGNYIDNHHVNFLYIHKDKNKIPEWRISDNSENYVSKIMGTTIPNH